MDSTSTSLLARATLHGDGESWQRFHDVYAPLIRNWLSRQNVFGSDADDLTQDVLIVVLRKLPAFQHNGRSGAFRRWLRLIVVNVVRDSIKKKRVQVSSHEGVSHLLSELEDESSSISQQWGREHDLEVTRRMLDQLKTSFEPKTWEAFDLLTREELPAKEVAMRLSISVASVYQAKSRVLSRLRQSAGDLLEE
ncbi:RNA polymerase sigma factor [Blastopirellula retiformator]|uniref:RNA polymerase sigma factor n=1 Tax=Blastopirellula retiformator TaxID=2527970 RepID=UPI0011B38CDD|nr:sigma-70 family RNA polymerase sigma factor [Blastopirellula retiformator]